MCENIDNHCYMNSYKKVSYSYIFAIQTYHGFFPRLMSITCFYSNVGKCNVCKHNHNFFNVAEQSKNNLN